MEPEIFWMHQHLQKESLDVPFDFSRDIALASVWLGMMTQSKASHAYPPISIQNVRRGVSFLNENKDVERYVFLTGPDKEKMTTFVKTQAPRDVLKVITTPFAIRLSMKDSIRPSDRMMYLSELNGVVINLHRRGLFLYENKQRNHVCSGEMVKVYGLLSAIPTLTYTDYVYIKLLEGVTDDIFTEITPYLKSRLVTSTLSMLETTPEMDAHSTRMMFKDLIASQPIKRIHHLSFQTARLLIN